MHKLSLLSGLALLVVCVACGTGGGGNTGGFGGGGTTGSFSNSSLKGNYAYVVVGFDLTDNAPFREAGVFVADGNGNITSGEDDFAENSTVVPNVIAATNGAYSVSSDGTASLTLNFNNGGGTQVALSVVSAPTVYLAASSIDPLGTPTALSVNGTGYAVLQNTSSFSVPSGTFVFRSQDLNTALGALTPIAKVGTFTVSNGTLSAGAEDQLTFGSSDAQLTLTAGSFNAPDSMGRGTGTFTDNNSHTSTFIYYEVDGSHLHLFSSVAGTIGVGRAVAQTGTSLSGNYVFGSKGDDSAFFGGVNTAGQFTASAGSISSGGTFDTAQDGAAAVNGTYTGGSYTTTANGRSVVTLTSSSGSVQEIYWVVSPSQAFFITNDSSKVEAGTASAQSSSSFSKSSVNGAIGFAMDGFTTADGVSIADLYDRVGNLHFSGSGQLGLTEFLNVTGNQQLSGIVNGSYTVSTNGRLAVSGISNFSQIIYLASGTEGYMVQTDGGYEIDGMMGTAQ